jgi:hypothetical protein
MDPRTVYLSRLFRFPWLFTTPGATASAREDFVFLPQHQLYQTYKFNKATSSLGLDASDAMLMKGSGQTEEPAAGPVASSSTSVPVKEEPVKKEPAATATNDTDTDEVLPPAAEAKLKKKMSDTLNDVTKSSSKLKVNNYSAGKRSAVSAVDKALREQGQGSAAKKSKSSTPNFKFVSSAQ